MQPNSVSETWAKTHGFSTKDTIYQQKIMRPGKGNSKIKHLLSFCYPGSRIKVKRKKYTKTK